MKRNLLAMLSLFTVGFLIGIFFLGKSFLAIDKIDNELPVIAIGKPRFDIKTVYGIIWEFEKSKILVRKSRNNHFWEAPYNSQIVDKRLDQISKIYGKQVKPFKNVKGVLTLKFNNGREWKAVFNDTYFRWVSGKFKGEGGKLLNDMSYIFKAGRSIFSHPQINWCLGELIQLEGKRIITGNQIKRWAKDNCSIDAELIVDKNVNSLPPFINSIKAYSKDGKEYVVKWTDNGLFKVSNKKDHRVFLSKNLLNAIKSLKINPQKRN